MHFGIPHHNDAGRDDILDVIHLIGDVIVNITAASTTADCRWRKGCCSNAISRIALATAIGPTITRSRAAPSSSHPRARSRSRTFSPGRRRIDAPTCPAYRMPVPQVPMRCCPTTTATRDGIPPVSLNCNTRKTLGVARTCGYSATRSIPIRTAVAAEPAAASATATAHENYDYEVNGHTRGLQADFGDQINAQNLLSANVNYITSTTLRLNNDSYLEYRQPASQQLHQRFGVLRLVQRFGCRRKLSRKATSRRVTRRSPKEPSRIPEARPGTMEWRPVRGLNWLQEYARVQSGSGIRS